MTNPSRERMRLLLRELRERKECLSEEEIVRLLALHPDLPDLERELRALTKLDPPPPLPGGSCPSPAPPNIPAVPCDNWVKGQWVGHYKLLRKLGEGGMGIVWKVQQTAPVMRTVALKGIRRDRDSAQAVARFYAERQALALMDHPNIPKLFEASATEAGQPYLVMELVDGIPVTQYCDDERLTLKERLEHFIVVCEAVAHVHQRGILHRDLKPSNVLIGLTDGKPVAKIIDFGLAKAVKENLTERTVITEVGQIVGTPAYMAPEQARLTPLGIDKRADIYSLGVLLYELLTGGLPFSGKRLRKPDSQIINEGMPVNPSTKLSLSEDLPAIAAKRRLKPNRLKKLVRGELDRIAMKCLERERSRRYQTANDLALAVRHYLDKKPHPTLPVWALALAVLLACAAVVAAVWRGFGALPTNTSPPRLESARGREASGPKPTSKEDRRPDEPEGPGGQEVHPPDPGGREPPGDPPKPVAVPKPADWLADLGDPRGRHWGDVYSVAFSADGKLLATADSAAGQHNALHLWDAGTLRELDQVSENVGLTQSLAFSDDGRTLASLSGGLTVILWDVGGRRLVRKSSLNVFGEDTFKHVEHIAFAPGGKAVLAWDNQGSVRRWDLSGREVKEKLLKARVKEVTTRSALSADGKTLARATFRGDIGKTAVVVCAAGGAKEPAARNIVEGVTGLALSSDGKRLALSTSKGLQLWDLAETPPRVVAPPQWGRTGHDLLSFSPDGTRLAAAYVSGLDPGVWVYDLTDPKPSPPVELKGHLQSVRGLAFGPDSKTLATCGADHTVRVWEQAGKVWRHRVPFDGFAGPVRSVAFSPDGRSVASLSRQSADFPDSNYRAPPPVSSVALWDVEKRSSRVILPPSECWYTEVAFGAGGTRVLACGGGWPLFPKRAPGQVRTWEAASGKAARDVTYNSAARSLFLDTEGKTFAVLVGDPRWDCAARLGRAAPPADDGPLAAHIKTQVLALAPDGKVLALVVKKWDGADTVATVHFFDATDRDGRTDKEVRPALKYGKNFVPTQMGFTPDGKTLVTAVRTSAVPTPYAAQLHVWDLTSQAERTNAGARSSASILALAVSPDGRTVATAEANHSVALWDISGKAEADKVTEWRRWIFPGDVYALAFDRGGKRLITGNANGTLTVLAVPKRRAPKGR